VKVVVHADPVAHGIPGGIGTYVGRLLDALVEAGGADLELLVSRSAGTLPTGWRHLPVRRSRLHLRPLYASWNVLRRPASGRGADVLHATNLVLPTGSRALVATVHDLNVRLFPELVPQPWRACTRAGCSSRSTRELSWSPAPQRPPPPSRSTTASARTGWCGRPSGRGRRRSRRATTPR
jgi:hypothetical protein